MPYAKNVVWLRETNWWHSLSEMTEEEFEMNGCVRRFHIYQDTWTSVIDEKLACRREDSNPRERYAVAVLKSEEIVGHVPRYMSIACSLFMRRGGSVYCTVTERRRNYVFHCKSFVIVKGSAKNTKAFRHEQFAKYGICVTYALHFSFQASAGG